MSFSCYGDQNSGGTTFTGTQPRKVGVTGFSSLSTFDMDCRGERGGLELLSVNHRVTGTDDEDDWDWQWRCMDGTTGSGGLEFTRESGHRKTVQITCPAV